jgi:serine/threonine-protein kinase RsbT
VSVAAERIPVGSDQDVVRVRQLVRTVAVAVKLSLVDQTKVVTAASELARNTLVYGGGGTVDVSRVDNGRRQGIRIVFADDGPGAVGQGTTITVTKWCR